MNRFGAPPVGLPPPGDVFVTVRNHVTADDATAAAAAQQALDTTAIYVRGIRSSCEDADIFEAFKTHMCVGAELLMFRHKNGAVCLDLGTHDAVVSAISQAYSEEGISINDERLHVELSKMQLQGRRSSISAAEESPPPKKRRAADDEPAGGEASGGGGSGGGGGGGGEEWGGAAPLTTRPGKGGKLAPLMVADVPSSAVFVKNIKVRFVRRIPLGTYRSVVRGGDARHVVRF